MDFSEYFILTFNDLFVRKNGYLFFLVIFTNNINLEWNLGTPFLRKYQFVYDYGNKLIGYYHDRYRKEEEERYEGNNIDKKMKKSKYLVYFRYILLITILSGILVGLGFFLGKKFYHIRKKRANELNDDDYEYKESGNKNTINE